MALQFQDAPPRSLSDIHRRDPPRLWQLLKFHNREQTPEFALHVLEHGCVAAQAALEQMHRIFDGQTRWQINERVDVVRIHEVDFHVNFLLARIVVEMRRQLGRAGFRQQRTTIQRGPSQMQPDARVGMEGHVYASGLKRSRWKNR